MGHISVNFRSAGLYSRFTTFDELVGGEAKKQRVLEKEGKTSLSLASNSLWGAYSYITFYYTGYLRKPNVQITKTRINAQYNIASTESQFYFILTLNILH